MAKNELIQVWCFDNEIGSLGWDEHKRVSYFQYNPNYLASNKYQHMIPDTGIIKRISEVQVFNDYNNSFKGLPSVFADSLPDIFGNIVFKTWLERNNKQFEKISVIEQLAYVANRGMGAFEYKPKKDIPPSSTIQIEEIVAVLKDLLALKNKPVEDKLNDEALLNIFKMGTSAGGVRPKILIAENKKSGQIIPGDIEYSNTYEYYLVKLNLNEEFDFKRELIEYAYYQTAIHCGITMMPSNIIEGGHFATKRFDRINGDKIHVLTASGISGWDFNDSTQSSYENLFELSLFLKLPHTNREELFRRMVFNIVMANNDDHLKNHSFIYDPTNDSWTISPAYDITYSLNPLLNFKKTSRSLSINNKRNNIQLEDVKYLAKSYTVRNYHKIIDEVHSGIAYWKKAANELYIPKKIIDSISNDFVWLK